MLAFTLSFLIPVYLFINNLNQPNSLDTEGKKRKMRDAFRSARIGPNVDFDEIAVIFLKFNPSWVSLSLLLCVCRCYDNHALSKCIVCLTWCRTWSFSSSPGTWYFLSLAIYTPTDATWNLALRRFVVTISVTVWRITPRESWIRIALWVYTLLYACG